MKERPILFSAPMVRALLDGRKTQTRRVVKPQPVKNGYHEEKHFFRRIERFPADTWLLPSTKKDRFFLAPDWHTRCPYGAPGDRLWVKETHAVNVPGCERGLSYRADHHDPKGDGPANPMRWIPSIHMRRVYSRLTLEVTEVRVERVQDICENDAVAEGVEEIVDPERFWRWKNYMPERESSAVLCSLPSARESFWSLWESINGTASLSANPWVWVVSFRRVEP